MAIDKAKHVLKKKEKTSVKKSQMTRKTAPERTCFSLDQRTIDQLDELTFQFKRKAGRHVSASGIVRVAISQFSQLDEKTQLELLRC